MFAIYSTCVVSIESTDKIFRTAPDGENFCLVDIKIGDSIYPGVVSEYIIPKNTKGKYQIECYLRIETVNGRFFTYLNILYATKVNDETEEQTSLKVVGRICKNAGIRVKQRKGTPILLLTLKYTLPDGNKTLVHCLMEDKYARQYHDIAIGTMISGTGHLQLHHGVAIEFIFDSVEVLEDDEKC